MIHQSSEGSDSHYFSSEETTSGEEISRRPKQPTPQWVGDVGQQRNFPHEIVSSGNNSGNCCSEGIILKAIPYRDFDAIFSVFTPQHGKVNLIKKGARKGENLAPLTHIEFTYYIGKSDLYTCHSLSVIHHHLSLRKNLATLETACELLKAVEKILVHNQDTSPLFHKLLYCFQLLPQAKVPKEILAWFYLVILKHEGILPPQEDPIISALVNSPRPLPLSEEIFKKIQHLFYLLLLS